MCVYFQKLKGETKSRVDSDSDDMDYAQMLDAKERSQDRRKNLDAQKFDKKSIALNELKLLKQEKERKEKEKKEKERREQEKRGGKAGDSSDEDDFEHQKRRKRRDSSSSSSARSYRSRSSSSSSASSSSAGDDHDDDSDTERFKSKKVQKYIETQEDLEPIRLSRFKMERFVHLPHFKNLVTGCFVRIGIGQNEGRSIYRCTEIVDVCETAKVYNVGKARTNTGLKLKFGKQERVFRLEFISNSQFSPSEFEKWKQACLEAGIGLPTKDYVDKKHHEVKKAMQYEYSSEDVDQIIKRKEKFMKNPVNYAMTKVSRSFNH